jgi:hypothetical protein
MTQVLDNIDVTFPGAVSPRQFGRSVSSDVPLAGGSWVAKLRGAGAQEAIHTHAAVSEFDYKVFARPSRWKWRHSESGYVTADLVTGIFGFGEDLNAAIVDLAAALQEHRDVLERQDSLSPDLQDQLNYLRALF